MTASSGRWSHPAEIHVDSSGKILPEYWKWRQKGFLCKYPVRYPVDYKDGSQCMFSLMDNTDPNNIENHLNYITATGRKYIYLNMSMQFQL